MKKALRKLAIDHEIEQADRLERMRKARLLELTPFTARSPLAARILLKAGLDDNRRYRV
jgi:hypothetical protein